MAMRNFNPDTLLGNWSDEKYVPTEHNGKTFAECIRAAFNIPKSDIYVYRAQGETTLDMTQKAINGKRAHGLHGWYHDEERTPASLQYPTQEEINAYTDHFNPTHSLPKALNSFKSNAKAHTLRSHISTHLSTLYHNDLATSTSTSLLPSKKPTRHHTNPYLSIWTYSCRELEWAGPWPNTVHTTTSHHMLPILYHHFGCAVPSHAALHVIARLAQPAKPSKQPVRPVLDLGSGNGYWTFMLRRLQLDAGMKPLEVRAVDNFASEYRVLWVEDTIRADAAEYLKRNEGGKGCVALLVYPQATGGFTEKVLKGFEGEAVVVVGTQNGNGFTGFVNERVDGWVERELGEKWVLRLRVPVPSFAGKDEAMFVFLRRDGGEGREC